MRGIKKINQDTAVHGACMPKDTIVIQGKGKFFSENIVFKKVTIDIFIIFHDCF